MASFQAQSLRFCLLLFWLAFFIFLAGILYDSRLMTEALRLATGPMIEHLILPQRRYRCLARSSKGGAKSWEAVLEMRADILDWLNEALPQMASEVVIGTCILRGFGIDWIFCRGFWQPI